MRLKPLREQVVVVTGASSGIGLATARMAAEQGARIVAAARNEAALQTLANEINHAGGQALAVPTDVGDEQQVQALAHRAIEHFGSFDTWVNNAGVAIFGKGEEVSLADHKRLFDTNYWGIVHGMLAALPHLRRHGGALINVGSVLCDRSMPLQGPYNASKHAVKAFTDTVRMELEHDRAPVSLTLIKPESMATPLQHHAKSYLPVRPRVPPPAYEPRLTAHAILHAAQTPVRELVVGNSGPLLGLAEALAPEVIDRAMEATLFELQETHEPRRNNDGNLYRATTGGEERIPYPFTLSESMYTRLTLSTPARAATGVMRSLAAGAAVTGSRSAASLINWLSERRGSSGSWRR